MRAPWRNLLVAAFLVGVLVLVWRLQGVEAPTSILLLTSAERQPGDSASLSAAGRAGAESLSRMAGDLAAPGRVAAILSAGGEPERETVRPLAQRIEKPISDVLIEDPAAFARGLARRYRGEIVIIVASTDLAAALLAELDGAAPDPAAFGPGRLHLVSLASFGQPRTLAFNYSAVQPPRSYSEEDEALYRKRFQELMDRSGRGRLAAYDPLKDVAGAAHPIPLKRAATPGISAAAIEAATEYARAMNSSALLIWRDGALEAEEYFGDIGRETPVVSLSLAKPLSVIAAGRALHEGYIASLDEPAARYFHEWRSTPRAAISIRHLLGMRSGLKPQAPAPDIGDILNRAYLHPRHDEILIDDYPLTDEPGSRYEYSNANSELVAPLIERAAGIEYEDWVSQEILAPLGAQGGQVWMNREGGTAHAGCCWLLPPETWLRLAILLIDDGEINGRRLLPEGFVAEMTAATPENPHAGLGVYVAGHYIERRGAANPDRNFGETLHSQPYLARDLFLFDGNANQVIYIVPSARLIVARLGSRPPADPEWDNAYLINTILRGLDAATRSTLLPQPALPPN